MIAVATKKDSGDESVNSPKIKTSKYDLAFANLKG